MERLRQWGGGKLGCLSTIHIQRAIQTSRPSHGTHIILIQTCILGGIFMVLKSQDISQLILQHLLQWFLIF